MRQYHNTKQTADIRPDMPSKVHSGIKEIFEQVHNHCQQVGSIFSERH